MGVYKSCGTCGRRNYTCPKEDEYCDQYYSRWIPEPETISFPILNNLTPTIESCTKKVFEEIGELMQLLGKGQRQSGEFTEEQCAELWVYRVIEEGLDSAQSLVTLIDLMIKEHNLEIETFTKKHDKKLREKKYLV